MDSSPESSSNLLTLQAQIDQISSHLDELLRNLSSASAEQIEAIRSLATASQTTLAQAQSDFALFHSQSKDKDVELEWKNACLANLSVFMPQSALNLAMRAKDLEAVRVLLVAEEREIKGSGNREAAKRFLASRLLHSAASIGFDEGLRYLLTEKHAHIDTRNQRGETPLQIALASKRASTVSLLLFHGASVHINNIDETLVDFMLETQNCVEVRSLMECGADLTEIVLEPASPLSNDKSPDFEKTRTQIAALFRDQCVREAIHPDGCSETSANDKMDEDDDDSDPGAY